MILAPLYRKSSLGKLLVWRVWTEGNVIHSEYGQVDGKLQHAVKKAKGMNIGRSNETSPEEQADIEALAMHKKRVENNYVLDPGDAEIEVVKPMLAYLLDDHKHKINWVRGVLVQPKLNGLRCNGYYRDNQFVLMSRQKKEWEVLHELRAELESLFLLGYISRDQITDGEIYVHGVSRQVLTSWAKKLQPETARLELHLYDVFSPEMPEWIQEDRADYLLSIPETARVKIVKSVLCHSEAEVMAVYQRYLDEGYEGAIVRTLDNLYTMDHRSDQLLKVKPWQDGEYKVVGFKEGRGKFEGCVIWKCVTEEGKEFDVTPEGTLEDKAFWFQNAQSFIGKFITVLYREMSDDGKPCHAKSIGERLPEDR
jgi:ATP-dependent DNA ligase